MYRYIWNHPLIIKYLMGKMYVGEMGLLENVQQ